MEQKDPKRTEVETCFSLWAWIIQLVIWCAWVIFILGLVFADNLFTAGVVTLSISYIIYLITMCCSPTLKYLSNLKQGAGIHEKMGQLFQNAPSITFHATCYHYETRHYTTQDSNGRTQHRTEQIRVNTHYANEDFQYYSVKDVSGLFLLNMSSAFTKKKDFIKLHLLKEINFADSISYADYILQKEIFWRANRYRDAHMDFSETRAIPGFEEYNLVQIGDNTPPCFSVWIYVLFCLIPFAQIYKSYIDSCCVRQNYTIRKIVSTRYNLLSVQYEQQFVSLQPALNLYDQPYSYEANQTGVVFESYQPPFPSQEELAKAQQYNSYVPNYQTDSSNGVVQDCNNVMNINYDLPPPSFQNLSGSVSLPSDQIISGAQQQMPQQQIGYSSNQMQGNMNINMNVNMNYPNQQDLKSQLIENQDK